MQVDDPKSPYYGWHQVLVPAGKPTVKNGFVRQPEMSQEMYEWLNTNVGRSSRSTWVGGGFVRYPKMMSGRMARIILIKDMDKALLFKLAWS